MCVCACVCVCVCVRACVCVVGYYGLVVVSGLLIVGGGCRVFSPVAVGRWSAVVAVICSVDLLSCIEV